MWSGNYGQTQQPKDEEQQEEIWKLKHALFNQDLELNWSGSKINYKLVKLGRNPLPHTITKHHSLSLSLFCICVKSMYIQFLILVRHCAGISHTILTFILQLPWELSAVISLNLQMRKFRFRRSKDLPKFTHNSLEEPGHKLRSVWQQSVLLKLFKFNMLFLKHILAFYKFISVSSTVIH